MRTPTVLQGATDLGSPDPELMALYSAREVGPGKPTIPYERVKRISDAVVDAPSSLGSALGDSLIGLLGWLVEKYHEWTHVKSHTMPDDEIITFPKMH